MLVEHVFITFLSIAICQLLYGDDSNRLYPANSTGIHVFSVLETNTTA